MSEPNGTLPAGASLLERASRSFVFAPPPVPVLPSVRAVPRPLPVQVVSEVRPQAPPPPFRGPLHPVDRETLREQGFIAGDGAVTELLEEFRIVKRQLVLAAQDSGSPQGRRILIASAHPREGKTYCAINLALSIAAERDSEVLLVDADFGKPSILSTLGLPGGAGLMDALADPTLTVEDCILGTDVPGLWVLPAGRATGSDTEYLASARTSEVLDRLTAHAPNRLVLFDSPPVLAASPASELAMFVGQAVVVVRADRTGEAALKDALSLLSACETIHLLLNGAEFSPTGRRFGAYYGAAS